MSALIVVVSADGLTNQRTAGDGVGGGLNLNLSCLALLRKYFASENMRYSLCLSNLWN